MNSSEYNEKMYSDEFDQDYHSLQENKIKKILKMITNKPKKVLDVGCGDGWVSELIKNEFKSEVHGLDISGKLVSKAKKRGVKAKKVDLAKSKWPYKNKSFDLIIAGDIIEHLYDTEQFIQECRRLLKDNGELIISVPNINNYLNRVLVFFGRGPMFIGFANNLSEYEGTEDPGHVRVFNKKTIKMLLEHHGFKINEVKGVGLKLVNDYMPSKLQWLTKLGNLSEKLFSKKASLASLIIVKASKAKGFHPS